MRVVPVVQRVHGREDAPRAPQPRAPDSPGCREQCRFFPASRGFQRDAMPSGFETARQPHVELHDVVRRARRTYLTLASEEAIRAPAVLDDDLQRILARGLRQTHGHHRRCTVPRDRHGLDAPFTALALEQLPRGSRVLGSLHLDAEHLHCGEQRVVGTRARFPVLVAPVHLDAERPRECMQVAPPPHGHAGSSSGRGFVVRASNRRRPAIGMPIQSGR